MTAAASNLTQAQQIQLANATARMNWLKYGVRFRQRLPTVSGALGSTITFPLSNVGISTGVRLFVSMPITVTAAMTASELGPHNLLSRVQVTDYSGIQRTNASGWQIELINCFKHRELDGIAAAVSAGQGSGFGGINSNVVNVPTVTGAATLCFVLYIPFAYSAGSDLTGALLTQTTSGQINVSIQLANALVGSDAALFPYTAGTATGTTVNVTPEQEYLGVGNGLNPSIAAQLPQLDLGTAYGVFSNTDTSNLSAGTDKDVFWPTGRVILSALHFYEDGNAGVANEVDVNSVKLLMNSNTPVIDSYPVSLRYHQRVLLGTDIASGVYYIGRRNQPVNTALTGQVSTRFNLASVAGSGVVAMISAFETQNPLGSALPGLNIASA